ncbi:MAG: hypothetical protein HY067_09235 [Betaproteobacteria bacterium]|nr:hypothetical protein [Betaproteobacteria bacterium]
MQIEDDSKLGASTGGCPVTGIGREFNTACGAGGTVKNGVIEVQGDHCERGIETLRQQGRTVKRAGG